MLDSNLEFFTNVHSIAQLVNQAEFKHSCQPRPLRMHDRGRPQPGTSTCCCRRHSTQGTATVPRKPVPVDQFARSSLNTSLHRLPLPLSQFSRQAANSMQPATLAAALRRCWQSVASSTTLQEALWLGTRDSRTRRGKVSLPMGCGRWGKRGSTMEGNGRHVLSTPCLPACRPVLCHCRRCRYRRCHLATGAGTHRAHLLVLPALPLT